MEKTRALAFDLGASNGRGIIGTFDGEKLTLDEIHRFSNDSVEVYGDLHWDVLRLFFEIKKGITKCINSEFKDFKSIGIDTWGVDYGLLDKNGKLLGNPFYYRDERTFRLGEKAYERVSRQEVYQRTGIQFIFINTLLQLMAQVQEDPDILQRAQTFLMMPDLLNYFLTGERKSEYTNASTTMMLNPYTKQWDFELLEKAGIPTHLFLPVCEPGGYAGKLSPKLQEELGCNSIDVVNIASHDTASAIVSIPALDEEDYVYISSGTWSLMGMELSKPCITDTGMTLNFTNEGGINNTIRYLKNIMGLWIIQETRRQWEREGEELSFSEIVDLAMEAKPFKGFIDPDDDLFATAGNMPKRINEYLSVTGQPVCETKGEIARCIFESLAMKYRHTLEGLEAVFGKKIKRINIIGGGIQNELLCQYTANASGLKTVTGPVEATAIGNLLVQFMAQGRIKDLKHARQVVANSFPVKVYQPENPAGWNQYYQKFKKVTKL